MKSFLLITVLCLISLFSPAQATFSTSSFKLELNDKGQVTALLDVLGSKDYVYSDTTTVLLRVKTRNQWELPSSMKYDRAKQTLLFRYPSQITIQVRTMLRFQIEGDNIKNLEIIEIKKGL